MSSSWTYIIIAVGITLYSFYTGIQEKKRREEMSRNIDDELLGEDIDFESEDERVGTFNREASVSNLDNRDYKTNRDNSISGDSRFNIESVNIESVADLAKAKDATNLTNRENISNTISVTNVDNTNIGNTNIDNKENSNTFKDRLRKNPKDLILYSEILRPKYQDF